MALLCSVRDLLRPGAGVSRRISVGELASRAGPCEVPALSVIDPDLAERMGVLVGLHANGDDLGTRAWPKSTRERTNVPYTASAATSATMLRSSLMTSGAATKMCRNGENPAPTSWIARRKPSRAVVRALVTGARNR